MLQLITKEYYEKQIKEYLILFNSKEDKQELAEWLQEYIEEIQEKLKKYLVSKEKSIGKNFFQKRIDACTETTIYLKQTIKKLNNNLI